MINDPIPRNKRPLTAAQAFERIATSRDTRDDRCRRLLHDAAFDFKTREQEHEEALIDRVPRAQSRQLGIMLMALEADTPTVDVQGRGIAAPAGARKAGS